jgi:hypothetical protein
MTWIPKVSPKLQRPQLVSSPTRHLGSPFREDPIAKYRAPKNSCLSSSEWLSLSSSQDLRSDLYSRELSFNLKLRSHDRGGKFLTTVVKEIVWKREVDVVSLQDYFSPPDLEGDLRSFNGSFKSSVENENPVSVERSRICVKEGRDETCAKIFMARDLSLDSVRWQGLGG